MRNRALFNSPRIQYFIVLGALMSLALSLAGCGGGGGGGGSNNGGNNGNNPPGNTALATITGLIRDTSPSHNPVPGATVTVFEPGGLTRTATSNAAGTFVVTNVDLASTTFKVASPDPTAYYNYANYHGNLYDLVACTLTLPVLVAGANSPFTDIELYVGGSNPPPPPPVNGCPA